MEVDIDAEYMQVVAVEDETLAPVFRTQVQELLKECDIIMSVNREGKIVEVYQHANQRGEVVDIYILACDEGKSIMMHITGTNLKLNNIGSLMNTL
jgi:rRNA pseudouridine-1189 N-methylase Emg1 (Nep1/Mra1 family)